MVKRIDRPRWMVEFKYEAKEKNIALRFFWIQAIIQCINVIAIWAKWKPKKWQRVKMALKLIFCNLKIYTKLRSKLIQNIQNQWVFRSWIGR